MSGAGSKLRRAAGKWTAAWAVLLAVQGLLPLATVWLTRPLVDALTARAWRPAAGAALLMAAALVAGEILRSVAGWVHTAQAELVQDHIQSLIHRQSVAADLAFYDSADFYDHLHRARAEASYRPVALIESLGSVLQNGITLVAMGALLARFGLWVPAALAVTGAAMVWMGWRRVRGLATLGEMALFYQAFQQGLKLMRGMLENAGQLYSNVLFLGNLFEFLVLEPQVKDCSFTPRRKGAKVAGGVRFDGVTLERVQGRNGDAAADKVVPR